MKRIEKSRRFSSRTGNFFAETFPREENCAEVGALPVSF